MKRALAFLVFGPLLASGTALLVMAQTSGPDHGFAKILATAVFFFTLPVAAITGCVDSVLHDVPILVRAGLTAAIGAIVTFSLVFLLFGWSSPPRSFLMFLAFLTVIGVLIYDLALALLDPRIRLAGGSTK